MSGFELIVKQLAVLNLLSVFPCIDINQSDQEDPTTILNPPKQQQHISESVETSEPESAVVSKEEQQLLDFKELGKIRRPSESTPRRNQQQQNFTYNC